MKVGFKGQVPDTAWWRFQEPAFLNIPLRLHHPNGLAEGVDGPGAVFVRVDGADVAARPAHDVDTV